MPLSSFTTLSFPLLIHYLSSIHPSFDLCPYSCPCNHDEEHKGLNLRDYLYRFPLPSVTRFPSVHASYILLVFSVPFALCLCLSPLFCHNFLSLHFFIWPAVYTSLSNPSALGRIVGLIEKTQSFSLVLIEVIYVLMWRVCLWLKRLVRKITEGTILTWQRKGRSQDSEDNREE